MDRFETVTVPIRKKRTVLCTWLVLAALALIALKVAVVTFLFLEVMLALVMLMCIKLVSRATMSLVFTGKALTLTDEGAHQEYQLGELTKEAFRLSQTPAQQKQDRGDLRIAGFFATVYDVTDFEAMRQYIESHF